MLLTLPMFAAGNGTEATPYTVAEAIAQNNSGAEAWVVGYIVGWYDYNSNSALVTTLDGEVAATNIALADNASETTAANTLAIQLPAGDLRTALNLKDNPANLGKKVAIKGKLIKYFGICGLKECNGYKLDGTTGGGGGETPVTPPSPTSFYTVAEAIAQNNSGAEAWVVGYIVGWYDYNSNSALVTTLDGEVAATNIALADNASETTAANTLAIQLPAGDLRTALNLKDNPANLGKKVAIKGKLIKYFGICGLKECTEFNLDGTPGTGGETPVTPPATDNEANPYTCTETIALGNPGNEAWIRGYIIGWYDYNNNSTLCLGAEGSGMVNTNIALADNASETVKDNTVAVQLPNGEVRTALNLIDHPENVGKYVALKGKLVKYFGITGLKDVSAYKLDYTNAITEITRREETIAYDLQGRRVAQPTNGIFIINGRKVLVK